MSYFFFTKGKNACENSLIFRFYTCMAVWLSLEINLGMGMGERG